MLKFSVKKKMHKMLAGVLSAAMAMTMVPEIWLPINAEMTKNEIIEAELLNVENSLTESETFSDDNVNKGIPVLPYKIPMGKRVFADAKEKHAIRYTNHSGSSQVTNWVRLIFVAMNLKNYAVHRWKNI